jgi:hypothetical protein
MGSAPIPSQGHLGIAAATVQSSTGTIHLCVLLASHQRILPGIGVFASPTMSHPSPGP